MGREDYAIIVGLQRYPYLGDLEGPENDAQLFRDWVLSPTGGDVPRRRVKVILSSGYRPGADPVKAKPTAQRVFEEFAKLYTLAQASQDRADLYRAGRRLYIYFAGHGFAASEERIGLLMPGTTEFAGMSIPVKVWADRIFRAGMFDEIVLFVDCCANFRQEPPPLDPFRPIRAPDAVDRVKRFYGFAAKPSKLAREGLSDVDGKVHGIFTQALLRGLDIAACNGGRITAKSLREYVHNALPDLLPPGDREDPEISQVPMFDLDPEIAETFVLVSECRESPKVVPTTPTFPVVVDLLAVAAGTTVEILGGRLETVASTVAVPPTWELKLERGLYRAQIGTAGGAGAKMLFEVTGVGEAHVTFS